VLWWEAIILGLVQGATEFLPISSSGHLLLFENILGIPNVPLSFEIWLHLGTILAVFIYFFEVITKLNKSAVWRLTIATLPIVVGGLLLSSTVNLIRNDLSILWLTYAITAILLLFSHYVLIREKDDAKLIKFLKKFFPNRSIKYPKPVQALMIGLFQVLAVLPGISRSGSTISAGLIVGLQPSQAFMFSFLLSIPAVMGAVVFDIWHYSVNLVYLPYSIWIMGLGLLSSAVTGLVALKLLEMLLKKKTLWPFAIYCGIVSFVLFFIV